MTSPRTRQRHRALYFTQPAGLTRRPWPRCRPRCASAASGPGEAQWSAQWSWRRTQNAGFEGSCRDDIWARCRDDVWARVVGLPTPPFAEPYTAPRGHCGLGAPRSPPAPEQTTLYRLVQQQAASFIAHTEASTGSELPGFIKAEPRLIQHSGLFVPGEGTGHWLGVACKAEFDAFLERGILAHGFLRLRCGGCGHDKLRAFSCKRRGFYPSCGACRRPPPTWRST